MPIKTPRQPGAPRAAGKAASPSPEAALAQRLLERRREREEALGAQLFRDPAWDMLLDLFVAQEEGRPVTLATVYVAPSVPITAAHRWVLVLEKQGLLVRIGDPVDFERSHLYLSGTATAKLRGLLRSWL